MTIPSLRNSGFLKVAVCVSVFLLVPTATLGQTQVDPSSEIDNFRAKHQPLLRSILARLGECERVLELHDEIEERVQGLEQREEQLLEASNVHSDRLSKVIPLSNQLGQLLQEGLGPISVDNWRFAPSEGRDSESKLYPIYQFGDGVRPLIVWISLAAAWQEGLKLELNDQVPPLILVADDSRRVSSSMSTPPLYCPDSTKGNIWEIILAGSALFLRTGCDYGDRAEVFFDIGGLAIIERELVAEIESLPNP